MNAFMQFSWSEAEASSFVTSAWRMKLILSQGAKIIIIIQISKQLFENILLIRRKMCPWRRKFYVELASELPKKDE